MNPEELQSRTISFLRFPLIVGVVLIHVTLNPPSLNEAGALQEHLFPVYSHIRLLFSEIFGRLAVPLFFLISGFLFFYRTESFTAQVYGLKLKKRVRSLLLPYLLWNLLFLSIALLSRLAMPDVVSNTVDYTPSHCLLSFWDTSLYTPNAANDAGHYPINFPLWFIRDLMVMVLISPLLCFLLTKAHAIVPLVLGILWGFNWGLPVAGFSPAALFFFSTGACISLHKKNLISLTRPLFPWAAILFILTSCILLYINDIASTLHLRRLCILAGIVTIVPLTARMIEHGAWRSSSLLATGSFFLYASHSMVLRIINKIWPKLIPSPNDWDMVLLYLLCTATTVALTMLAYALLRNFLPIKPAWLTGGGCRNGGGPKQHGAHFPVTGMCAAW